MEFMKVSKQCNTISDCKTILNGKESSGGIDGLGPYGSILADGTSISFSCSNMFCIILVDIDGINKGSNYQCKDIFKFIIRDNKLSAWEDHYLDRSDTITDLGQGENRCTAWVIVNGNMDYLKLNNGKCPDGKTLTFGVKTSCK